MIYTDQIFTFTETLNLTFLTSYIACIINVNHWSVHRVNHQCALSNGVLRYEQYKLSASAVTFFCSCRSCSIVEKCNKGILIQVFYNITGIGIIFISRKSLSQLSPAIVSHSTMAQMSIFQIAVDIWFSLKYIICIFEKNI